MKSQATISNFSDAVRREADEVHFRDQLFGWRHGIEFEGRDGLPFGAENGHWATGINQPGLSMDLISGRTRLIVRIAGREPADIEELERWFARCFSSAQVLERNSE